MPSQIALQSSQTVRANAAGVATAQLSPDSSQETWEVNRIIVSSDSVLQCSAGVYRNFISLQMYVAGSLDGRNDVCYGETFSFAYGEKIVVVWTGCTPNSSCSVTLEGNRTIGGRIY